MEEGRRRGLPISSGRREGGQIVDSRVVDKGQVPNKVSGLPEPTLRLPVRSIGGENLLLHAPYVQESRRSESKALPYREGCQSFRSQRSYHFRHSSRSPDLHNWLVRQTFNLKAAGSSPASG